MWNPKENYQRAVESYRLRQQNGGIDGPDFHPAAVRAFGVLFTSALILPIADAKLNDRRISEKLFEQDTKAMAGKNDQPSFICEGERGVFKLGEKTVSITIDPFTPCQK